MHSPSLAFYQDLLTKSPDSCELSDQAFEQFNKQGFPTRKTENWKYTPINALQNTSFNFDAKTVAINHQHYEKISKKNVLSNRLFHQVARHTFALLNLATSQNFGVTNLSRKRRKNAEDVLRCMRN